MTVAGINSHVSLQREEASRPDFSLFPDDSTFPSPHRKVLLPADATANALCVAAPCFSFFQLSGEVTYAELCLARPTTLSTLATDAKLASLSGVGGLGGLQGYGSGLGVIVGGKPYAKEATVYACIDHNARPAKVDVSNASSCAATPLSTANVLQDSTVATMSAGKQHHPAREVVTVRTPLISTQESCV